MPIKKITQTSKTHKGEIVTKQHNHIDDKIIEAMFNKEIINDIARKTGFVRRQRKLDVFQFFFFNHRFIKSRCHESNRNS